MYLKYYDNPGQILPKKVPILKDRDIPERNNPCLCASGKKYKKCCLPADSLKEKEQLLTNRMFHETPYKHARNNPIPGR